MFEYADTFTACMRADGTLAAHRTVFDTDRGAAGPHDRRALRPARPRPRRAPARRRARPAERQAHARVQPRHRRRAPIVIGPTGLDTIDVSNPAAPVHLGHHDGEYNDVRVVHGGGKTVAFAAPIQDEHVAVIDVTDPRAPHRGAQDIPEYAHSLQIQSAAALRDLYLANYTNDVPRYDVTSPLAPVLDRPGAHARARRRHPRSDRRRRSAVREQHARGRRRARRERRPRGRRRASAAASRRTATPAGSAPPAGAGCSCTATRA